MTTAWTPEFLRRLEALAVVSKRAFAGRTRGERRSPRKGASVEFADFRNYVQGDDHRHIDWNAYARFEGLFLKLFMEEEDLAVQILLDASRSMDFGGKFTMASRIGAALGYVGLANFDRVSIHALTGDGTASYGPTTGRQNAHAMLAFIDGVKPGGQVSLERSVQTFADRSLRPGVVILVSDFLDPGGFDRPLGLLRHRKCEPVAIQVLSREELDPPEGGDWRFVDSETGATLDLSLGRRAVKTYKARLEAFTAGLDRFCKGRDIPYLRAAADQDFEELILKYFREAALVG